MTAILLTLLALLNDAPVPTAGEIMRRVAVNQDREQKARNEFVYEQKVHRTVRAKDGKLMREEFWTYTVSPGAKGSERKLVSVTGRYWKKGRYIGFEGEPVPSSGILNITLDDGNDSETRDGVDKELFPLTSDQQQEYVFELGGEREVKGRPVYRIEFGPAKRNGYGWTGEALIDKEEFQPVSVYTRLSRKLPLAVRTMLGTDVPGLGFSIQYTRVDKDLWFPASYGTEFGVRALFLLNRTLMESMENSNFRRVNVDSRIEYAAEPER